MNQCRASEKSRSGQFNRRGLAALLSSADIETVGHEVERSTLSWLGSMESTFHSSLIAF
jgi:hypothetical protein